MRSKNIYGLGVGISIVFKMFSNFLFLGVGLTPRAISNVLHRLPVIPGICVSEDLGSIPLMVI
jgi:hypothetical protein